MPGKKLLAANWKENPGTEAKARTLFKAIAGAKRGSSVEIAICPPFIYLEELARIYKAAHRRGFFLGAQDVFWEERGPYTSEVGPAMLASLGVSRVIIGHSERRRWLHETDAMINKKIMLAVRDNLGVILCVGESLAIRKKGIQAAETFIKNQLKKDLQKISRGKLSGRNLIIAYEPIWAIGTGQSDTPHDARRMAVFIKGYLRKHYGFRSPKVLYGGSVNKGNIGDFVQLKEIDGALVGGASLHAAEFKKIVAVAAKK